VTEIQFADVISIHIILKAQLKNVYTRLWNRAFLIKVHHRGNGERLPTEPTGEFQDLLTEFQGLFGEPTYANLQKEWKADLEIKTNPNGKTPFRSPYRISPCENAELQRQLEKAIRCGWIQPSGSNFSLPVLFVPKPDGTLCMCMDYYTVNTITIKDRYPLPHIEELLNCIHGFCWFTKLDLAAGYHQIHVTQADRQKTALTTKFGLYKWRVLPFGLANAPS